VDVLERAQKSFGSLLQNLALPVFHRLRRIGICDRFVHGKLSLHQSLDRDFDSETSTDRRHSSRVSISRRETQAVFLGLGRSFLTQGIDLHSQGVIYALLAAVLWGAATVVGKSVSSALSPTIVTFWRYSFGLSALLALFWVSGDSIPMVALHQPSTLKALTYIAFFPGLTALLFYYSGLKRATAISATFTELLYPVSAVILNWVFLGASLNIVQILGGLVLLYSVSQISLLFG
jgi:uncharacterized membrane protein